MFGKHGKYPSSPLFAIGSISVIRAYFECRLSIEPIAIVKIHHMWIRLTITQEQLKPEEWEIIAKITNPEIFPLEKNVKVTVNNFEEMEKLPDWLKENKKVEFKIMNKPKKEKE